MSDKDNTENNDDKLLYCSFCGKNQNEVRKLIAGPSVYICNECIDLCNDIIKEEISETTEDEDEHFPVPQEIKATLDEYVIGQEQGIHEVGQIGSGFFEAILVGEFEQFFNL